MTEERGAWREDGSKFPSPDINRRPDQAGENAEYAVGFPGNPGHMNKVGKVMGEYKSGTLRSSSGSKVTNPKQAVAIGLSEQRRAKKG